MNIFAQTPTDSFWNPANWAVLAEKLGVAGFLVLALLAYIVWKEWRISKSPVSNRAQVRMLKLFYADAQNRNTRLRRVMRSFCDIVCVFSRSGDLPPEAKSQIEAAIGRVQDALDANPPPIPDELSLDNEK